MVLISQSKLIFRLNNQKKFVIFVIKVVSSFVSKIFAIVLFSLFYIFMIYPIINQEFNPSFFDLVNLFIFHPAGYFSIYIFYGIFLTISSFLTKVLHSEIKFKTNKFLINIFNNVSKSC